MHSSLTHRSLITDTSSSAHQQVATLQGRLVTGYGAAPCSDPGTPTTGCEECSEPLNKPGI